MNWPTFSPSSSIMVRIETRTEVTWKRNFFGRNVPKIKRIDADYIQNNETKSVRSENGLTFSKVDAANKEFTLV